MNQQSPPEYPPLIHSISGWLTCLEIGLVILLGLSAALTFLVGMAFNADCDYLATPARAAICAYWRGSSPALGCFISLLFLGLVFVLLITDLRRKGRFLLMGLYFVAVLALLVIHGQQGAARTCELAREYGEGPYYCEVDMAP